MIKRLSLVFLIISLFIISSVPLSVMADTTTQYLVEQIIAGNQDMLVFANIIEKGTNSYEMQIMEQIASPDNTSEEGITVTDIGDSDFRINVEGPIEYMYYDDHDYRPQMGDNLLLSLEFNGNSYSIKNGAYRVDLASSDQFSFMVPESITGSQEALELSALYIYVKSGGKTKDLSIRDGAVYGKDANGEEEKLEIPGRLKFIDEVGDVTDEPSVSEIYGEAESAEHKSYWELSLVIIAVGLVIGVFIVNAVSKFEKKG